MGLDLEKLSVKDIKEMYTLIASRRTAWICLLFGFIMIALVFAINIADGYTLALKAVPLWLWGMPVLSVAYILVDNYDIKKEITKKQEASASEESLRQIKLQKRFDLLKDLTAEEKSILKFYVENKSKAQKLRSDNGVVARLEGKGIIYKIADLSEADIACGDCAIDYNIHDWAYRGLKNNRWLVGIEPTSAIASFRKSIFNFNTFVKNIGKN